jgi:hypothetical protein
VALLHQPALMYVPFASDPIGTYLSHLHLIIRGAAVPVLRNYPQMDANHRESTHTRGRIAKAICGILR